ncbi:PQQ-like beta-propeller repeat protein [Micromonospora sp. LAH09]|uniref:outer membrane protein assembly factor BamB family protein n=1 Tax=Micromonospora cabrerizensis TaxID=2911213 RepID=UPI001EE8CCAA|nr:PQQ-binding-like beta-propeller repeat protein [Micromonospora cabrerizensis]MCG5472844.1 PQQ-like beta-propeller repeat protein [Micromonospora cabrerizensis]
MSDPVIDLGELRHGTDPEPLPRPPRANGRQVRCGLVLLLALVTLAASAVSPPRRAPLTLPARPGADVLVDGDLVLVMEPASPTGQGQLAAYRLPGGEPVWQAPLSAEARYWGMFPLAGMMLATGYEIGPEGRETRTVALDQATGAYRWQQPGTAFELTDGNLLLRTGGETLPSSLRAVDTCCGTVRWQLPATTAEINVRDTGQGVDRVVLNQVDGPVEVRDAITGAVLARADLRPPDGGQIRVDLTGDLLLAIDRGSGTVTAYGLDQLDRRWTRTGVHVDFALDCGAVLCVRTGNNELQAVDPATGELRWSNSRWGWAWPYDGRLIVNALTSEDGPSHFVVLDPLTGWELADLGRWDLYQLSAGDRLVGTRQHPDGGKVVGEVDVRAGKVRVLDVLPQAAGECQAITGHLVCGAAPVGSYRIWRLPD